MASATKGQYQMMIMDTGSGLQRVRINLYIALKAADEKRKRNATASLRFRQRRKEKDKENIRDTSNLERRIRVLEGEKDSIRMERDCYRGERGFSRDIATLISSQASILLRPFFPRQERTITHITRDNNCIQSKSCEHGRDRSTRRFGSVPSQSNLMPSKLDTSNRHLPQKPLPSRFFDLSAINSNIKSSSCSCSMICPGRPFLLRKLKGDTAI